MITILTHGHPQRFDEPLSMIDNYDLDRLDPGCQLLLIGMHADQIHLERRRALVDGFLARGGTAVFCGHLIREVFSGAPRWQPAASRHQPDLRVTAADPHPVWAGVDPGDLSIRRGVSGFYGRGGYPELPEGALVINTVQQLPLDVELRVGGGRVLLHGGNDLWGYRSGPGTAARIWPQLLSWGAGRWT